MGVAVLLANATVGSTPDADYSTAAQSQLDALLYATPRSASGAISHRTESVQLWRVSASLVRLKPSHATHRADSLTMVPPFLAFAGLVQNNASLLREACASPLASFSPSSRSAQSTNVRRTGPLYAIQTVSGSILRSMVESLPMRVIGRQVRLCPLTRRMLKPSRPGMGRVRDAKGLCNNAVKPFR